MYTMSNDDEMMNRIFEMVKTKIEKEKPKKKTRKRTWTPESRKVMLANLKKGRERKKQLNAERKAAKALKNKKKTTSKPAPRPKTPEPVKEVVKEAVKEVVKPPPPTKLEMKVEKWSLNPIHAT